jgi:threonine dehydratase
MYYPRLNRITEAVKRLSLLSDMTPLQLNHDLTRRHMANVYVKREDMGLVRSYKWRGANNAMLASNYDSVVTCSAGNHAQGVAFGCSKLGIKGTIFMPVATTLQKINKVKQFGGNNVRIFLEGANFDESFAQAKNYAGANRQGFIHPFDDERVIEGQATVGVELYEQMGGLDIDYLFLPIGGGGLASGVSSFIKEVSPQTKIIGVEPLGAASMSAAIKAGCVVKLSTIDTFVDGAAVKRVGDLNFPICQKNLDDMILVDEGHVCSKIIQMYNENGFIIEPAGVLSLCALDIYPGIKGRNVVCVISGGNSDVFRMPEILERSLVYEGLKHYFKIHFAQKAGSLKEFILKVLGPGDDIIYFRYQRAINKETGPVVIGLQLQSSSDIQRIIDNMNAIGLAFEKLDGLEEE